MNDEGLIKEWEEALSTDFDSSRNESVIEVAKAQRPGDVFLHRFKSRDYVIDMFDEFREEIISKFPIEVSDELRELEENSENEFDIGTEKCTLFMSALIDYAVGEVEKLDEPNEARDIAAGLNNSDLDDLTKLDDTVFGKSVYKDQFGDKYIYFSIDEFESMPDNQTDVLLGQSESDAFDVGLDISEQNQLPYYVIELKMDYKERLFKKEIVYNLLKAESLDEITCGDTWVNVEGKTEDDFGYFTQIEVKELENGEYDENTYLFYVYRNTGRDEKEYNITDYRETVISPFELDKDSLIKIKEEIDLNTTESVDEARKEVEAAIERDEREHGIKVKPV